jgi:mTERF domain-containing protein
MLRLGRSILTQVISSHSIPPVSQLRRLLSATAPRISPNPSFAVEEYLVGTCGLTRAQALKASPKLSHLKSPTNPDAVLAFLAGLGLSGTDVAGVLAKDPKFLCTSVEKTLTPNVIDLTGNFRSRQVVCPRQLP